ncbi:MAG: hypothetical protein NZ898_07480 [Myxococcota bacterium]|nr:hypothetical protein [Myxococcota bacterium]
MSDERLAPATPVDDAEARAYAPRLPWRVVGFAVLVLASLGSILFWREREQREDLRARILEAYDRSVAPIAVRQRAFRDRIEGWIRQAASRRPERRVDPRLRISALGRSDGVYLRLTVKDTASAASIAAGARAMGPDAITRCLGLAPTSLRGLYAQDRLFDPAWRSAVERATGTMQLRVLEDELSRRLRVDLPNVIGAMRARWFLFVLQRGKPRHTAPIDVHLWDLREGTPLLAVRTQPAGILVPVRASFEGAPPTPPLVPRPDSPGAHDCSIAAQVKELTGEPVLQFGSTFDHEPAPQDGTASEAPVAGSSATPTPVDEPPAGPQR